MNALQNAGYLIETVNNGIPPEITSMYAQDDVRVLSTGEVEVVIVINDRPVRVRVLPD